MRRTAQGRRCYPHAFFEGPLEGSLGLIADRCGHRPCSSRFGAPVREPILIGKRQCRIHRVLGATAIVRNAKRVGIRLGRGPDHVPAA
jgi:hypothetical protein